MKKPVEEAAHQSSHSNPRNIPPFRYSRGNDSSRLFEFASFTNIVPGFQDYTPLPPPTAHAALRCETPTRAPQALPLAPIP